MLLKSRILRTAIAGAVMAASLSLLMGAGTTKAACAAAQEKKIVHPIVTIHTAKGDIKIKVYPEEAPKNAANFLKLAKDGYYNGLAFHRVEPGFVIQGGDPLSKKIPAGLKGGALDQFIEENRVGRGGPDYTIPNENVKTLKHNPGAVAFANRGRDTANVQFYIVITNPAPSLDEKFEDGVNKYTIFGQVISGQDVAEKIEKGDKMLTVSITPPGTKSSDKTTKPAVKPDTKSKTGK